MENENSEIYSSSRHSVGFYKCVVNTCRYVVPVARLRGQDPRQALEIAIAHVVLGLPSLGVGIIGEDTPNPHFVALPSIHLDNHVEYLEGPDQDRDAPLLRILEKQHNQAWPAIASRPPWKTTVISYAGSATGSDSIDALVALDVVFAVHHSIADGRSTAAFHARLLSELTRMAESPMQLSGRVLSLPENPQFVRPLEEAVRFTQSWPFLLRILWREFAPAWLQPTLAATWTGGPITREPCQTNLRLVVLPANRARKVLAACREHQTTLTPLLHALTLISLTKHVPAEVAGAFSSSTPIDLRPFMEHDQPSQDAPGTLQFGVLVTTQQHRFEAPVLQSLRKNENVEDTLWRVAAELRSEMKRRLEGLPGDDIISMLGWISDWRKFWLTKLGKQRETTWEVSNIGSMVGSSEDANGWRIERSIMSQGATVSGAAIGVNVAGISKGDVCMTLSWQEGIVDGGVIDSLAADLLNWFDILGAREDHVRVP